MSRPILAGGFGQTKVVLKAFAQASKECQGEPFLDRFRPSLPASARSAPESADVPLSVFSPQMSRIMDSQRRASMHNPGPCLATSSRSRTSGGCGDEGDAAGLPVWDSCQPCCWQHGRQMLEE